MYFKLDYHDYFNGQSYIKFYEQYIFDPNELPGINTYKFNLRLGAFKEEASIFSGPFEFEFISFYATIDLKTLIKKDGDFSSKKIESFVHKHYKKEYKEAKNRLNRKLLEIIPEPIYYEYYNGTAIFLEFTEETAHSWSGPFKLNEKLGAVLEVKENEPLDYIINIKNISYYSLPNHLQEKTSDKEIYYMSLSDKEKYFNSLSLFDKHLVAKNMLRLFDEEWFESRQPFKLLMLGNDDTSYSKWFSTKEDLQKEINYLLKMQPLCIHKDIYQRGYIFTN